MGEKFIPIYKCSRRKNVGETWESWHWGLKRNWKQIWYRTFVSSCRQKQSNSGHYAVSIVQSWTVLFFKRLCVFEMCYSDTVVLICREFSVNVRMLKWIKILLWLQKLIDTNHKPVHFLVW